MFTVLLTGGIASGKSTVSDYFQELGVPVVDTDVIAREVVEPGEPALDRIISAFGPDYILPEGRLDRKRLKTKIFSDTGSRKELERILHPVIRERAYNRIMELDSPYCILVVPLYTGPDSYNWIDFVLVVDSSEETQFQRLIDRDGIDPALAKAILSSQCTRNERLSLADGVITNSDTRDDLKKRVVQYHHQFLKYARCTTGKKPVL